MSLLKKFKNISLTRFLEEIKESDIKWIIKRLSGNDTGLTGSHQAGVYLPGHFFKAALPEICTTNKYNPDTYIKECYFPNENHSIKNLRAIYYNSRLFGKGTRNEYRITGWGGSQSPVGNPDNTGSIFIFAVGRDKSDIFSLGWVASDIEEENLIEDWLGFEVDPENFHIKDTFGNSDYDITLPSSWFDTFPSGKDIFEFVINLKPQSSWEKSSDKLLLKRRELEFKLFQLVEEKLVLPRIQKGFVSVNNFIKYANSVANRRKSRTGKSLELNLEQIFNDEKLKFETQVITENKKKPDFIFPSGKDYHNPNFPTKKLDMLAAKTCCKDRWRQVINEANRLKDKKHLFTLQQGVSKNQLLEMKDQNIILVIPEPHRKTFPKECRESLLNLEDFITEIKNKQI